MANGDAAAAQEAPLRPFTLEEELRKNPQLKEQDVALLRDWLSKQPHLPPVHDRELALFLHLSDYSVERAKGISDSYFTLRTHVPELFSNRDPTSNSIQNAVNVALFAFLPKTTPQGYTVVLHCTINSDITIYNLFDILKLYTMLLDVWMLSAVSSDQVFAMDMKGITLRHVLGMNPIAFKKFLALQDNLLRRMKGIHYFNAVPFMDKLLALIKPFMKKEFRDIVHVHTGTPETFFEHVPQNILPEEFGGTAPSVKTLHERMQSLLLANREFFLEEEQRKVDEQKRPGRPRSAEDLFGVEGTFKKLDID